MNPLFYATVKVTGYPGLLKRAVMPNIPPPNPASLDLVTRTQNATDKRNIPISVRRVGVNMS